MHLPTLEDVRRADAVIRPEALHTPLVYSERLSDRLHAEVYLKLEGFQRTGAFKFRGALNAVRQLGRDLERGLVTASSGNHALGMALAARLAGVPATVVMPTTAPAAKQARARAYGARVILHGTVYDHAYAHALALAREQDLAFIPSFDHPLIIAGQGTIALEVLATASGLDLLVVPVGGGGLLAGTLVAAAPVEVVGVQAEGADSMVRSLAAGSLTSLESAHTVADGIATLRPGGLTFAIASRARVRVVTVGDGAIVEAMAALLATGVVAEPAGAAAVAALLEGRVPVAGRKLACVITGSNVGGELLATVARGLQA